MTLTRDVPPGSFRFCSAVCGCAGISAVTERAASSPICPNRSWKRSAAGSLTSWKLKRSPTCRALQAKCREKGIEVMYTTIESLTLDGRDRSLDYKITGFNVPKGSWDGKVIDQIAPEGDEIVLPKSSSSVFISTPHRLYFAQSGRQTTGDLWHAYGSMRRERCARCLRSGLSGHRSNGRLPDPDTGTPGQFPQGHQGILPPNHNSAIARGAWLKLA